MFELAAKIGALLTPAQRRRWLALGPLLFLTGAVETVSAGLVFLLIKVASEPAYALRAPALGAILKVLPWQGSRAIVIAYSGLLAVFFILRSGLILAVKHAEHRALSDTGAALSARVFGRYLGAPYAFHLRSSSTELAFDVTSAVERTVENGMGAMVQLCAEILVILGLLGLLIVAAPAATLATGAALAILVAAALRLTKRSSERWGNAREELGRQALKDARESLGGIRELKVLGHEGVFLDSFATAQRALARTRRLHDTLVAVPRLAIETIFVCCVVVVLALATGEGDHGKNVVPLLGLYTYAGFRLIPSANRVLFVIDRLRAAAPAIERLRAQLLALDTSGEPRTASRAAFRFEDAIVLDEVSFRYEGTALPVLRDVSATIRRGQCVAIVGATGAGKSTLVDLILGLLEPTTGRVTVDGVDVHSAPGAWRRRIGYVPQAAFLFEDTIRRNVALGVPESEIDEGQLRRALRLAQLEDFVASLPEGLDTPVGERGIRFSGGQRQRVAIARALYHAPDLLVLDEATAALDNQTEREVTRAIEALKGRTTVIIIAHRMTAVRRCDSLLFLREGRLSAVGTFDSLLADNAEFRAMVAVTGEEPETAV